MRIDRLIMAVTAGILSAGTPGFTENAGSATSASYLLKNERSSAVVSAASVVDEETKVKPWSNFDNFKAKGHRTWKSADSNVIKSLLEPDQIPQYQAVLAASEEASGALSARLQKLRAARQSADGQSAGEPTSAAVDSNIAELESQLKTRRKETRTRLLSLLTPDQRAKYKELRSRTHHGMQSAVAVSNKSGMHQRQRPKSDETTEKNSSTEQD